MSVTHRTDLESLLAFQITLKKELFHDAVCPLTVQIQRLGRVAEIGAVHQRLQYLTPSSRMRSTTYASIVLTSSTIIVFLNYKIHLSKLLSSTSVVSKFIQSVLVAPSGECSRG